MRLVRLKVAKKARLSMTNELFPSRSPSLARFALTYKFTCNVPSFPTPSKNTYYYFGATLLEKFTSTHRCVSFAKRLCPCVCRPFVRPSVRSSVSLSYCFIVIGLFYSVHSSQPSLSSSYLALNVQEDKSLLFRQQR